MRVLIATLTSELIGGVERYLSTIIPALADAGHQIGLICEHDAHGEGVNIASGISDVWIASRLGSDAAVEKARAWCPDVVYAHGFNDVSMDEEVARIAPTVFFAHNHFGICISGEKRFKVPRAAICDCSFGWRCIAQYYPRRCGGLSPATMIRNYRRESRRLMLLRSYHAILTASEYMRGEYYTNGISPGSLHVLSLPVSGAEESYRLAAVPQSRNVVPENESNSRSQYHVLFVGRMTNLKGGGVMLECLPQVCDALKRPVLATFIGDGPERESWARRAALLTREKPSLNVKFTGWLGKGEMAEAFSSADLIVMPSQWPEPFGLAGLEAGLHGIPAAAFAVGGIPEWLINGVSGFLAEGGQLSASALAGAIIRCLSDPKTYATLREGSRSNARRFTTDSHLRGLLGIFESVLTERQGSYSKRRQEMVVEGGSEEQVFSSSRD
jgi:glycosyltransferase involved in cell wall biosynthesis